MSTPHIFKQIDTHKAIYYTWFEAMHTRIDLALCNLTEKDSISLACKIRDEIKRIEKVGNRFDPESEVSIINQDAGIQPVKISSELFSIIVDCISFHYKTSGAFDITVISKNNYRNGINDIVLNPIGKTIFFSNKNVQIDLSGYLKGYSLDKVKVLLPPSNCHDALINMGNSSILATGNHPHGKGWKIDANTSGTTHNKEIILYNEFYTTSGNDTKERKHIIDPESGKYIEGKIVRSVVSYTGVEGEVMSTVAVINSGKCD